MAEPAVPLGEAGIAREQRFWSHVDRSGEGCWPWLGSRSKEGYGKCDRLYGSSFAHRCAYAYAHGAMPDGLVVHHRCGNPACVRPGHLELQSNSEHVRNHKAPGNRCKHGHEFTPENTYIAVDAKGREHRLCRACGAQRARAYRRERGLVGSAQARQTHCKRGYPFDEENTYRYQGKRICRTCRREAVRRMRKSP